MNRGTHDLAELAAEVRGDEPVAAIAYDIGCHSTGFPVHEDAWAARPPGTSQDHDQLEHETMLFLRAQAALEKGLPKVYAWLTSVVQVAVPIRGASGPSRSGNFRELPGLVFFNSTDEIQLVEAAVHEAAHKHFFLAEAEGPLVDPGHSAMYRSPLRPEPRPLRGVFLAYHALAYMYAFYQESLRTRLAPAPRLERELSILGSKLGDAQRVLTEQRGALTQGGRAFMESTMEVAQHADAT